jgi:hypothetical protein
MTKIHLNSLFNNILAKLNISLAKPLRDVDLQKVDESGKGAFLEPEDFVQMIPKVKDYRYQGLSATT